MARPTHGLLLDLLRPLASCRGGRHNAYRIPKPPFRSSPPFSLRLFVTSPSHHGLFSSLTSPLQSTSTPPPPVAQEDHPLTPFQNRIAALETTAHAQPESSEAQLSLLRELLSGGEYIGIAKYYEAVALNEVGEARSKVLLASEEAWGMFVESLGRTGRLGDVAGLVRRRDRLLAGAATIPAPSQTQTQPQPQPKSQSQIQPQTHSPETASSASTISANATSPTPAPDSSLSGLLSSVGSGASATAASTAAGSPSPGSPLAPIYVQMAPATPQMSAWRAIRWFLGVMIWAFILLTILSMVMENTGLLKAGPVQLSAVQDQPDLI